MNIHITQAQQKRRGFTLVEMLTAMGITTFIIAILVSVTSYALDTWNRSRSELRASRQAKALLDIVTKDVESMVLRRGNNFEWFYAEYEQERVGRNIQSTNASRLVFFSGSNDRYNGQIGVAGQDNGGDISCVGYQLQYRNPLGETIQGFETFVLNRVLVDPDETFDKILGQEDLKRAFSNYESRLANPQNFICENLLQFTVKVHVEFTRASSSGAGEVITVPVTIGDSSTGSASDILRFHGKNGIESQFTSTQATNEEIRTGRIVAFEVSATILTDFAIDQLRNRRFNSVTEQSTFLSKNSYEYTKLIPIQFL